MRSPLESIALPLLDCKEIPEGYFDESILVWTRNFRPVDLVELHPTVGLRKDTAITNILSPAPTLEEILEDLKLYKYLPSCAADEDGSYFTSVKWHPEDLVRYHRGGRTAVQSAWNTWFILYKHRKMEKEYEERRRLNGD